MHHPDQFNIVILDDPVVAPPPSLRSACLVPGCPCKDSRIVSQRRARFFAAIARKAGETADRVVPVEPAWAFNWAATADHSIDGVAA
jgi:hypothetical protein